MQLIRLLQCIQCEGGRYTFTGSSLPPSWPLSMVLFPLSGFLYNAISHLLPFSSWWSLRSDTLLWVESCVLLHIQSSSVLGHPTLALENLAIKDRSKRKILETTGRVIHARCIPMWIRRFICNLHVPDASISIILQLLHQAVVYLPCSTIRWWSYNPYCL